MKNEEIIVGLKMKVAALEVELKLKDDEIAINKYRIANDRLIKEVLLESVNKFVEGI